MPAVAGAGAVVAKQQQVPGRDPESAARASGVHNIGLGEESSIDPDAAGGLDHHLLPGQSQDPLNDGSAQLLGTDHKDISAPDQPRMRQTPGQHVTSRCQGGDH
nr:hypothetical protein [Pseudarthrobacter sp. BIM B-2242]